MLTIHLKPSRLLAVILLSAHAAAALILQQIDIAQFIRLGGLVAIAVSCYYYIRQDALLTAKQAVITVKLTDKLSCIVVTNNGLSREYGLSSSTFVSPYLTVLMLSTAHHQAIRSVVILPDMIDAETYRQLRVLLRWKWKPTINMEK